MKKHKCCVQDYCHCSTTALEPNEDCPLHGYAWPPRCVICGKFMKWKLSPVEKTRNMDIK